MPTAPSSTETDGRVGRPAMVPLLLPERSARPLDGAAALRRPEMWHSRELLRTDRCVDAELLPERSSPDRTAGNACCPHRNDMTARTGLLR